LTAGAETLRKNPKENQGRKRAASTETSSSTAGHEDDTEDVGNPNKRLRRNSTRQARNPTRQARPQRQLEESDSDVEAIDLISTDNSNPGGEQVIRSASMGQVNTRDKPHMSTSQPDNRIATQRYICQICAEDFPSASARDRHRTGHSVCVLEGKKHVVNSANVRHGGSHTPCDQCGMPVKKSDLQSRNGHGLNDPASRITNGDNGRIYSGLLELGEDGTWKENTARPWHGNSRDLSFPGPEYRPIAGETRPNFDPGPPFSATPVGLYESDERHNFRPFDNTNRSDYV
jgi:hypothetical protein